MIERLCRAYGDDYVIRTLFIVQTDASRHSVEIENERTRNATLHPHGGGRDSRRPMLGRRHSSTNVLAGIASRRLILVYRASSSRHSRGLCAICDALYTTVKISAASSRLCVTR